MFSGCIMAPSPRVAYSPGSFPRLFAQVLAPTGISRAALEQGSDRARLHGCPANLLSSRSVSHFEHITGALRTATAEVKRCGCLMPPMISTYANCPPNLFNITHSHTHTGCHNPQTVTFMACTVLDTRRPDAGKTPSIII